MVDGAKLLGTAVGHLDLDVALIGGEGGVETGLLFLGETLLPSAQQVPDPIQRVAFAAAVAMDFLLDAAPDIINSRGTEFHDMESVNDRLGVGEFVVDGVLVAAERIQCGDLDPDPVLRQRSCRTSRF